MIFDYDLSALNLSLCYTLTGVSLLHVEQEVVGDDTPALESVLDVLEERTQLLKRLEEIEAAQKRGEEASSDELR